MSDIIGHDTAIRSFLSAMRSVKMHHAWLLCGMQGIGKATTATALAKRLLSEAAGPAIDGIGLSTPADHRIGRLIDSHAHPDFILLERMPKDMKAIRDVSRRDWPDEIERTRNITVDQTREVNSTFALKPSFSNSRVVIIDAVDDMEKGAANALLKNLEEPPAGTIFLLISHAPGRLLPTIRSRCRTVRFEPLSGDALNELLKRKKPAHSDTERTALVKMADGSLGKALSFAGLDIAAIDAVLSRIASTGDASNALRASLVQSLSLKSAHLRYNAFLRRVPAFIASVAREVSGDELHIALAAWEGARILADNAVRHSLDPQMAVFAIASHVATLAPKAASSKA